MTRHYRRWLIGGTLLLVLSLGGALFLGSGPHQPTYAGKKLSAWLDEFAALDYSKRWDPRSQPAQAVRAIGTNALPWLLSELQADGNRFEWRLNQLLAKQTLIKFRFPDVNARLSRASLGFQALGELGQPAIPDLLKLVESNPGFVPGALAAIGPAAVPALQQCLTNTRPYTTSVGQIVPIPGNTIGAVYNAIHAGRLSTSEAASLMPAIRDWAQSTNRSPAQYNYAADFLKDFDHY